MSTSKITHSGNVLLAGFGGMLIMMSVLVYLSIKQDIPMVSKNYYEQELVYQDKLDAISNTQNFESAFALSKTSTDVIIQIPEALSKNMTQGTIVFYCPSTDKMDRTETLQPNKTGIYSYPLSALPGKAYVAKITMQSNGVAYYKELKLD